MLNEHMFKNITIIIRNPLQFIDFDNDSNETLYVYDINHNDIILSYKHICNILGFFSNYENEFRIEFEKSYSLKINKIYYNTLIIP